MTIENQSVVFIIDEYYSLTRATTTGDTTTKTVVYIFLYNWIISYVIPKFILTDNDTQFMNKFFATFSTHLGATHLTTTAYHTQINGQVEWYYIATETHLRQYAADHQRNWDKFVYYLTYAHNTQGNMSTKTKPFGLTLSRNSPGTALFDDSSTFSCIRLIQRNLKCYERSSSHKSMSSVHM